MGAPRAWGKKLEGYSTLASPRHGFVGAEADAAVGTYTFGARTYDPTLRRWVSPDPLLAALPGLDEAIGDNLNLYAYAGNNPVARVDLTGFWGEELKAALQNSPLANAVAGFAYGVTQGVTPGGVLMPNPAREAPQGAVFQHWQGAGQIIGGAVGVVANGDMVVKAAAADGISAGAATPVLAVSAAGVANGALAVQAGAKNIAEAQSRGAAPASGPARAARASDTSGAQADLTVRPRGQAGVERSGKSFTTSGKRTIDAQNAAKNGGANKCENCSQRVVPGQQHKKGVTPPKNERQRDHIVPRSKGGDGVPANGQTLCRGCNIEKSNK